MKGVVFTEFLEMVENQFGDDVCDQMIESSDLSNGGAYTSVGTYDYQEMIHMVVQLSKLTNIPVPELVEAYGRNLLNVFESKFNEFFVSPNSTFEFLKGIETVIHTEVRKLYPDAELPEFAVTESGNTLTLAYQSPRCLGDLALGLMKGVAAYYDEQIDIEMILENDEGSQVLFNLTRT